MLLFMTQADPEASHKPIKAHFSQNESNAQTLSQICQEGGWRTSRVLYQAKVLQAISKRLCDVGVLRSWTPPIGTKTISYSLTARWLKRLAPDKWSDLVYELDKDSTPEYEMERVLDLVYPVGGSAQDPVLPCVSQIPSRDAHQTNSTQAH